MTVLPLKAPLARISLCVSPGKNFITKGHSFLAIQPLDPHFTSGALNVNGQSFIGRIGIGLTPAYRQNSLLDRIQPARQLRITNDSQYLLQQHLRAITVEVHDETLLARGYQRINTTSKTLGQEFQLTPCRPTPKLTTALQSTANIALPQPADFTHSSKNSFSTVDGAVFLLEGFVEDLPPELIEHYSKGMSPKTLWRSMSEPLATLTQPSTPKAPDLTNLKQLLRLRGNLPIFLGETHLLLDSMRSDLELLEASLEGLSTELQSFELKYAPIMAKLQEHGDAIGPKLNPVIAQLPATIRAVSKLIGLSSTAQQSLDPAKIMTQILLSSSGRSQTVTALGNLQTFLKSANDLVTVVQDTTLDQKTVSLAKQDLANDISKVAHSLQKFALMGQKLVPRVISYLNQLNQSLFTLLEP